MIMLTGMLVAQPRLEWEREFASSLGNDADPARISLGPRGDVFLSAIDGRWDIANARFDSQGDLVWNSVTKTAFHERGDGVDFHQSINDEGEFYVAGWYCGDSRCSSFGAFAALYAPDGTRMWLWSEESEERLVADAAVSTGEHGAFALRDPGTLLVLDRTGSVSWRRVYEDTAAPFKLLVDEEGVVYSVHVDGSLRKTSANGEVWRTSVPGVQDGSVRLGDRALVLDSQGDLLVAGVAGEWGERDVRLYKYSGAESRLVWQRADEPSETSYSVDASAAGENGEIALSLRIEKIIEGRDGHFDSLVVVYEVDGTRRWSALSDDGRHDAVRALGFDLSGNVYVAGSTTLNGSRLQPVLRMYSADGDLAFTYFGKRAGYFTDVTVDGRGSAYAAGPGESVGGGSIQSLVKFSGGPDAGPAFLRGDTDSDGRLTVTDAVVTLLHLFRDASELECPKAADTDDTGVLNVADAVSLLRYLFLDGRPPADPFRECGADPTEDGLGCAAATICRE